MEDKTKLNSIVSRYQSGDAEAFRDLYDALAPIRNGWLAKASGRYLDDKATRQATFDDTLIKSVASYTTDHGRSFDEYLSGNLRRANATNVRNRNRKKLTCEIPDTALITTGDDGDTELTLLDTIADANPQPEEIVMNEQKKRDHRQVISILLAGSDELTRKIAINRVMYNSDNALAKALGVHHMVVKRTWDKIAARYDANRFGPVSQYLA